jgi:hypothetical protein
LAPGAKVIISKEFAAKSGVFYSKEGYFMPKNWSKHRFSRRKSIFG